MLSSRHSDHPVLVAITACNASASERPVVGYSQAADAFLPQTESPVLFVGQIVEADLGPVACKVTYSRNITYSVSTVLFGFAPPSRVKVTYPGCTKSDAPRSYQGRCVGVGHVLSAGSLWQPERVSRPGNRSEFAESAIPSKRGPEKENFSVLA